VPTLLQWRSSNRDPPCPGGCRACQRSAQASHLTLAALFGGAGLCLAGVAMLAWLFTPLRTVRGAT
jgi:hypothetical protein